MIPVNRLAPAIVTPMVAVKFVESFTDYAVKPCDDLYRHVCGRWLRKVSKPTSFMADVARNFSVHRTTLLASDKKRSGRHAAVLEAVSKYYRSCTEYFSRKRDVTEIVTQLFRNLNITPTTWLQWENEHPVFKELVRLSVVYQLPSFFLVSIEQNAGNATWTIYRGKAFLHRISDGNLYEIGGRNATDYFRKVLKTIGEAHATDWTMKTIIEIDKTLAEAFNNESGAVTQTQPFGELVCGNFPPKVWLGTLNSIPGDKPQANENTTVYAPSFSNTCQDLNRALRNPNSRIRTLYALALIAAEVLRFDYQLSAEDVPDVTKLAAMCYEATRFAFEDIWVQVISAFLSMTKNSETSIRDYFQYIINGISMYTKWMDEVDRAAVEKMLSSFKLLSFSTGVLSDEQLRCSRYDRQTDVSSKDYVLNRVRVYDRVVGRCFGIKSSFPASNLKDLLGTGLLVDAVSKLVVIPHMFGTPPIYYENLAEQYINFALPGSLLARKIFRVVYKGATWRKRTLEKVQSSSTRPSALGSFPLAVCRNQRSPRSQEMAEEAKEEVISSKQDTAATPTEKQADGLKDSERDMPDSRISKESRRSTGSKGSRRSSRSKGSRRSSRSKRTAKKEPTMETSGAETKKAAKRKRKKRKSKAHISAKEETESAASASKTTSQISELQITPTEETAAESPASKDEKSRVCPPIRA
ncbi:hypothetical protein V5799_007494 [Amblyomma americanum]|uniref:Peptidase M13 N-terminal domain-containing protein n=1 Tax=Amblyomma americanum TaxID=6943 RepID=A0AAQ4FGS2_AMBAM